MARPFRLGAASAGVALAVIAGTLATAASWNRVEVGSVATQAAARSAAEPDDDPGILTPPAPREPRINGPSVYGVRPDRPFLYRIPATGDRPMPFAARSLPGGLTLDAAAGIIRGTVADSMPREYQTTLVATNSAGRAERAFRIVVGDTLALTPPMGWNDWYTFYEHPSDALMRKAADIMVHSGMADHGYQYVNIDDSWMGRPGASDPDEQVPARVRDLWRWKELGTMTGRYTASVGRHGVMLVRMWPAPPGR